MIAWDILVTNSTAPAASIAWVHLNSQGGGGSISGGRSDLILIDGAEKLTITAQSETISLKETSDNLTLKADKKGLIV